MPSADLDRLMAAALLVQRSIRKRVDDVERLRAD